MAKLILLLVIACFQFSQQEKFTEVEKFTNELIEDEIAPPVKDTAIGELPGDSDEGDWISEKDDKLDEEWTEEDEKWLQEVKDFLEENDEDYDDDSEETGKIIDEIEKWIEESHSEKSKYEWLLDVENWSDKIYDDDRNLELSQYPNYIKNKEDITLDVDENDSLDLYYSWLYRMTLRNFKNEKVQPSKRFSSV